MIEKSIHNNQFLLELFPAGITNMSLGNITFRSDHRIYFDIHISAPPSIAVSKWGTWGEDYNVIVVRILAQFIRKVEVVDIQMNSTETCKFKLEEVDGEYLLNFSGENWFVFIRAATYTFQECSTFLNRTD